MNNAISVKDRLKNLSRSTGKTMQELLTAYGLERTIYRISVSDYADKFTLKGGIFLYALYEGDYARATTDMDFLAQGIDNDISRIKGAFSEIFSVETDDPLRYDLDTLEVIAITEFKEYHGVNVSIKAFLERTRVNISIDIGFGDVIYPDRVKMEFPTVLSDERPIVYAYSLVSSIAEKFEAIVSLAYDNSRFKDFYDIYVIAGKNDFSGVELSEAVRETFENRGTSLTDIVAFDADFADDPIRQSRWRSFVKKKRAMLSVSLEETIEGIRKFMFPVAYAVRNGNSLDAYWSAQQREWR